MDEPVFAEHALAARLERNQPNRLRRHTPRPDSIDARHDYDLAGRRRTWDVAQPHRRGAFAFDGHQIEPLDAHKRRLQTRGPQIVVGSDRAMHAAVARDAVFAQPQADRAPRALADGQVLSLERHALRWFDTPHVPHGWDAGLMMEISTRTLLAGDLFTQGGSGAVPLIESDILEPSEAFGAPLDYFAHAPDTGAVLERLAREQPTTLACMRGSAWRGDGAALLRALARQLQAAHASATERHDRVGLAA